MLEKQNERCCTVLTAYLKCARLRLLEVVEVTGTISHILYLIKRMQLRLSGIDAGGGIFNKCGNSVGVDKC